MVMDNINVFRRSVCAERSSLSCGALLWDFSATFLRRELQSAIHLSFLRELFVFPSGCLL